MDIGERIEKIGIVPVVKIEEIGDALPLADAMAKGGLPAAEITFRTAHALAAIEAIASSRPEILVGGSGEKRDRRGREVYRRTGTERSRRKGLSRSEHALSSRVRNAHRNNRGYGRGNRYRKILPRVSLWRS